MTIDRPNDVECSIMLLLRVDHIFFFIASFLCVFFNVISIAFVHQDRRTARLFSSPSLPYLKVHNITFQGRGNGLRDFRKNGTRVQHGDVGDRGWHRAQRHVCEPPNDIASIQAHNSVAKFCQFRKSPKLSTIFKSYFVLCFIILIDC